MTQDKVAEIDKQSQEEQPNVDYNRRRLFTAFTALSTTLLGGCLSEDRPTKTNQDNQSQSGNRMLGGNGVTIDCGCMPGTPTTPAPTPPATGATPATPAPAPATPTPAAPSSAAATFASIGPDIATLTVADMMSSITLSDGRVIQAWSFTSGGFGFNGNRLVPGPVVECIENAPMQLTLSTMMPHTIHLHGLDVDTLNDGVPATSFYVAGSMMGGAPPMAPPNLAGYASVPSPHTYSFTPLHSGTYMYHCHVDTVLHMEMGMSGTIIVRPADGSNTVWSGGPAFDKEYVWQLHTFDTSWHGLMQSSAATARYRPDVFLINGMEGSNLLSDTATAVQALPGERVLIRLVNPGYLPANVNLGDTPFDVVSSDGRPLLTPVTVTDFVVGPGERYDIMFDMPASVASAVVSYRSITGLRELGAAATVLLPT